MEQTVGYTVADVRPYVSSNKHVVVNVYKLPVVKELLQIVYEHFVQLCHAPVSLNLHSLAR